MHQRSPIKPFVPDAQPLHPVLQAALDNLDVQLEEELVRYRRQRRQQPDPTQWKRGYQNRSSVQGVAPSKAAVKGQSAGNRPIAPFQISELGGNQPNNPVLEKALFQGQLAQISEKGVTTPPPQQASAPSTSQVTATADWITPSSINRASEASASEASASISTRQLVTSSTLAHTATRSAESLKAELTIAPPQSEEQDSGIASYAQQTDLSAFEPNTAIQRLLQQDQATHPEDYLASTEELLRSIAEEDPELRADRRPDNLLDTLLTPLGIGSMLLLLLSSSTLGYVIMNPSSLGFLAGRSSDQPSATVKNSTDKETASPQSAPLAPDLSAEEFVDLNLETLSTLPKDSDGSIPTPTKPNAAATARTNATSLNAQARSTSQATRSSVQSVEPESLPPVPETIDLPPVVVSAEPPIDPPAPAPDPAPIAAAVVTPPPEPTAPSNTPVAPTSEAPAVSTSPAPASPTPTVATAPTAHSTAPHNYYYVVTEYSGDPSLQEARETVPDAYVRNLPTEGAKVQLGAFRDEARAQELIQQLENQGIPAQVYQP